MREWIKGYLSAQERAVASIDPAAVEKLVHLLVEVHARDGQVFTCGNGASAANASHFAADLGKNASGALVKRGFRPFRILSLNDNTPWMTALANDYCYEEVYSRQLANYARAGDLLIAISVSGNSPNVIKAMEYAKEHGVKTVAIVAAQRGKAAVLADHVVVVEDPHYGRSEDAHMTILHMAAFAFVEQAVQPAAAQG
jgi:D-sedoheptulose 7-phosphate isomerase